MRAHWIAYLVGRRDLAKAAVVSDSDIDRRIAELERELAADDLRKLYAVFHYGALESELAHEQELAGLDGRVSGSMGDRHGG